MDALLGTWESEDKNTTWSFHMNGCTRVKKTKKGQKTKTGKWFLNLKNGILDYEMKGLIPIRLPLGKIKIIGNTMIVHNLTKDTRYLRK